MVFGMQMPVTGTYTNARSSIACSLWLQRSCLATTVCCKIHRYVLPIARLQLAKSNARDCFKQQHAALSKTLKLYTVSFRACWYTQQLSTLQCEQILTTYCAKLNSGVQYCSAGGKSVLCSGQQQKRSVEKRSINLQKQKRVQLLLHKSKSRQYECFED